MATEIIVHGKDTDFIPMGIYKHFKGALYILVCVAQDCNTGEHMVVYKSMETGHLYVRSTSEWLDTVRYNGEEVYRFDMQKNSFTAGL